MSLNTAQEIERAINALPPQELAKLYAWLDRHRPPTAIPGRCGPTVFEQGLGLFGSADDATLLDEAVQMAYEERRRPSHSVPVL